MQAIEIENLSKHYGKVQALKSVNLTIEEGMFGLLGQNGAGKTTLMKIMTTLLQPSEGSIVMSGVSIDKRKQVRDMVGYLPQDFSVYPNMSVYDAMDYLGTLSGLNKVTRRERILDLLTKVNLENNLKTKVKALSGGMKRRLGIAQALLNDPRILIVDEPTAGLDPEERVRLRNLFSEVAKNRIVILSTHIVGDIEATCRHIGILDKGQVIYDGDVIKLLEMAEGHIFEIMVSLLELDDIKRKYSVTNIKAMGDSALVRFIDLEKSNTYEKAEVCHPNVEDAYLYLLNKQRGGEDDGNINS